MKPEPHKTRPGNARQRTAACPAGGEENRASLGDNKVVARLIKAALHRELPPLYEQLPRVREMKKLAAIAEAAGDQETVADIRRCLARLAAEADF